MNKLVTGSLVAALVVGAPAGAIAARMHVDHGEGPTFVHDSAYDAVHSWSRDGSTTVRLMVNGLPPGTTYGAHVHTKPCGAVATDSGGHFQHSTDVSIPIADREVWLDITPDAHGEAVSETTVPWEFAPGTAGSVVLHAQPTRESDGFAGPRLACTTVTFGE
jgi:superoxide dismutase, Cu-Zn family